MADDKIELLPATLIQQAITSNASVEVMERLLALQERWDKNQAKKAFDAAMADLRTDLPEIIKNRTVDYTSAKGHTYYKYEDLHSVTELLSPVMAQHGLSFRWRTATNTPEAVTVTCIVSHRDGHSEETTLTASNDHSGQKNDIQALGSAVTYLQRYTLKAALGVAAGTDDDGDRAGGNGNSQPPTAEPDNPIIGKVEAVERKSGKKANGQTWTRYGINIAGFVFGTFDKTIAEFADKAKVDGVAVVLYWNQEGKFRNAVQIDYTIESMDEAREPGSEG